MRFLQQANFLESVLSFFQPKKISAEAHTRVTSSGDIEVNPVFRVGSKEVPAGFLKNSPRQRVQGLYLNLSAEAKHLLSLTKGQKVRLAKSKAAKTLESLEKLGVGLSSKDGRRPLQILQAKPDVSVQLLPNDVLKIESKLVDSQGKIIRKPTDLKSLKADDGWHADGDDLIQIDLTETPLDKVLTEENGNGKLDGQAVPRFIQMLQSNENKVGTIEKDSILENLIVEKGKASNRVKVTGDDESIEIAPMLNLTSKDGNSFNYSEADLTDIQNKRQKYKRTTEGWLEIDPEDIKGHQQAKKDLSNRKIVGRNIKGSEIPETLSYLNKSNLGTRANHPWNVYFSKKVADSHKLVEDPSNVEFSLNLIESDGKALVHLSPIYNHSRFQVSHKEAQEAQVQGSKWVRRNNAWVRLDEKKLGDVRDQAAKLNVKEDENGFSFPAAEQANIINVFSRLGTIKQEESYKKFLEKLQDFTKIEHTQVPSNIKSSIELRPYQQHGLNWLAFMQKYSLNGILADDMGLGKTLQTLMAIERAREVDKSASALPSLIICPASVILNWKSEIEKFVKHSRVFVYHGPNRENTLPRILPPGYSRNSDPETKYLITSYNTARIDYSKLDKIPWLYMIADEGHAIKNPSAQQTRAVKMIHGQHKLVLTGTPVQNKLEELWSLFDFAMPGYLGNRNAFQKKYKTAQGIDIQRVQNELKPQIRPFVLRRLKQDVAKDLPEKFEIENPVELSPKQVSAYQNALAGTEVQKLKDSIDSQGVAKSHAHIFSVINKLRNICNHPQLLTSNFRNQDVLPKDSGKLDFLKDLIQEVKEGEHRALLFSQSTRVLDFIEHLFHQWGITTLRIDGQTHAMKRVDIANAFNSDNQIDCLLLSTKAAGTGLNLTGADTVIFYDNDWNPANDRQAMDRAYRIGQQKDVTVYRLVSQGTIEQKILERQKKKQSLADSVITADHQMFKDLSKEELFDLFKLDTN
jgi:SNF2 family DNA or RNA helicase